MTSTTHLPTTQKYTGLLWVSTLNLLFHLSNYILVLHPKHKLKYFEKQGWDETWITTAKDIVKEEFRKNYATYMMVWKEKINPQSLKKVRLVLIN